ncbi:hypothetical protein MHYP_G00173900 [Metynnis hypsauchen]
MQCAAGVTTRNVRESLRTKIENMKCFGSAFRRPCVCGNLADGKSWAHTGFGRAEQLSNDGLTSSGAPRVSGSAQD